MVDGEAMTTPGFAPLDLEPVDPMLASRPALASGDSVEMKLGTEDWARTLFSPRRCEARRTSEESRRRTMVAGNRFLNAARYDAILDTAQTTSGYDECWN